MPAERLLSKRVHSRDASGSGAHPSHMRPGEVRLKLSAMIDDGMIACNQGIP